VLRRIFEGSPVFYIKGLKGRAGKAMSPGRALNKSLQKCLIIKKYFSLEKDKAIFKDYMIRTVMTNEP
ncbi:hypothetical protein THOM_1617, partial [Trachipleistophora hominis]